MNRTLSPSHSPEVLVDELTEVDALEVLLADTERHSQHEWPCVPSAAQLPGVVIGTLADISEQGEPLVRLPAEREDILRLARSVLTLDRRHLGTEVVLTFENGNPAQPIILGLLSSIGPTSKPTVTSVEVTADEDRLELTAEREIVLRCGKASITLTRAGKVLIRGAYVLSRSSGANRIKGGSVQIN